MPEAFDPYYEWLGIPPSEQPANHYRLLGIPLFEDHASVIEHAADRQMAHLRTFQAGTHGPLSQKLLNQVAAAKLCLLSAEKKAAYDALLRQVVEASRPADDDFLSADLAKLIEEVGVATHAAKGRKSVLPLWAMAVPGVAAGVLLVVFVLWISVLRSAKPQDSVLALAWPAADRVGAHLWVDDKPIALGDGPVLEYRCPPGSHTIRIERPGFEPFQAVATITAGQKTTLRPQLRPLADGES